MPDDPTPHGGESMHPLPDRAKIPEPKPGSRELESERIPTPPGSDDKEDTPKPSITRLPEG